MDGFADAGVVDAALASADHLIDGYLAGRYTLPLTDIPPLLTDIAGAIARYRLWKDRASDQVRIDYEDAVATLRRIASGEVQLPVDPGAVAPSSLVSASPGSRVAVFTSDTFARMPEL
jgi:phage gp36-like protein